MEPKPTRWLSNQPVANATRNGPKAAVTWPESAYRPKNLVISPSGAMRASMVRLLA